MENRITDPRRVAAVVASVLNLTAIRAALDHLGTEATMFAIMDWVGRNFRKVNVKSSAFIACLIEERRKAWLRPLANIGRKERAALTGEPTIDYTLPVRMALMDIGVQHGSKDEVRDWVGLTFPTLDLDAPDFTLAYHAEWDRLFALDCRLKEKLLNSERTT